MHAQGESLIIDGNISALPMYCVSSCVWHNGNFLPLAHRTSWKTTRKTTENEARLMWSLLRTPWVPWSGQDKEPEELEVKKQTILQRSRSEEKSPIAGETVGMDKGKLKPPGGPSGNAELDDQWQVVPEEELQVITTCKCKGRNSSILGYNIPCRFTLLVFRKP